MDIEEQNEIAHHRHHGLPETTKGPYYHKTWWESYKGAVKGMLGGIVVGGMVGAITGGIVIGVLAVVTTIGGVGGLAGLAGGAASATSLIGGIMAATTLFGMYEGKVKFEKVGTATGAIAAAEEISEVRMKEYLRDKVTGLTNEIRELKAVVAGKVKKEDMHTDAVEQDNAPIFDESDFIATHQTSDDPSDDHKLVYWNVATIGAVVGAVMAAVAIGAQFDGHFMAEVLSGGAAETLGATGHGAVPAVSSTVANTAMIATGAALGGSFGISRDIFRKIFDVTDCWFMGVAHGQCSGQDIIKAKGKEFAPLAPHSPSTKNEQYQLDSNVVGPQPSRETPSAEIRNVFIAEPQSTYFRDKISKEDAQLALLGMDHTSAMRH